MEPAWKLESQSNEIIYGNSSIKTPAQTNILRHRRRKKKCEITWVFDRKLPVLSESNKPNIYHMLNTTRSNKGILLSALKANLWPKHKWHGLWIDRSLNISRFNLIGKPTHEDKWFSDSFESSNLSNRTHQIFETFMMNSNHRINIQGGGC